MPSEAGPLVQTVQQFVWNCWGQGKRCSFFEKVKKALGGVVLNDWLQVTFWKAVGSDPGLDFLGRLRGPSEGDSASEGSISLWNGQPEPHWRPVHDLVSLLGVHRDPRFLTVCWAPNFVNARRSLCVHEKE